MVQTRVDAGARKAPRGPSQRQLRVGELVRQALSEVLRRADIDDPDLARVSVTVTEVAMSPDLRRAICYVMPLGGDNPKAIVKALARNVAFLGRESCRRLNLKFMPKLMFQVDDSFEAAARMDTVLAREERRGGGGEKDDGHGPRA